MTNPADLPCCREWYQARQPGTDNEGYGPLIFIRLDGTIGIGSDLPPLVFCPWCGVKKS